MTLVDVAKQAYTAAKRDHDAASLAAVYARADRRRRRLYLRLVRGLNRAYDYAERAIMLIEREYPQFGEDDDQNKSTD